MVLPLGALESGPSAEKDAAGDGENEGLEADGRRNGETDENEMADRAAMVDDGVAEIEGEHAFQIFYILHPERRIQSVVDIERAHDLFGDNPVSDKWISGDSVHQKKSGSDDTPEGEQEDEKFSDQKIHKIQYTALHLFGGSMLNRNVRFQNKFHFTSLGCARNLVDTEVMIGILLKNGYEAVVDMAEADYLVVNTCGFLQSARQEGMDTIQEMFAVKKPDAKVIVAGCMVQKHSGEIKAMFPEVHYMLGSGDVEKILDAVRGEAGEAVTSARSYLEWGEVPRMISTPKHYAYLKIAEGCKKRCAFCIIPTIKGPLKSKTEEQVLKEFNALLSQGVFEVILIAQDLGDFGKDRLERGALAKLLRAMLQDKRPFWLRLLYLYPDEIDDELIEVMKSDKRICPYLDMPMQHINDGMLKAMHRATSKAQILEIVGKLRREIPDVTIRTSLMVGFPGETEEQFEELVDFVKKVPLDNVGIFKFSLEKEAYAAKLNGQIDEDVKERRFKKLAAAQMKVVEKRGAKMIGKKMQAIVEGFHPESNMLLRARHAGQCPEIDGQIIVNDGRKVTGFGELYEVEITDVAGYDLIGRVVGKVGEKKQKLVLV